MPTVPFGRWLREARIALDLTQEALAERTGCAVQTIRKIEAGERRPSQQMAHRLAQALELPRQEQAPFLKAARAHVLLPAATPSPSTPAPSPLRTPALPALPTRFFGRQAELAEVRRLLDDPAYRLVSLVGPGGIGKTRLALEAVRGYASFTDGVIFVPLAPIGGAPLLAPAIADAVGFTFSGPEPPLVQLLRYLQSKALLLVLDNLEHLLGDGAEAPRTADAGSGGAAETLARILEEAPAVKLLVTSRERVNLRGEWTMQLAGLSVGQGDTYDEAPDADALVLFVERARQRQHDFALTPANRPAVARICRLLEGMPLGIELAATWVRVLSCGEIVAELERGLDFLEASTHDLPARHRSMRAVFEHSWQLLPAEEQQVLRRLAVFRGGFTRAAAAEVAGASLVVLAALVDKSLVRRGGERYDLHEVVRQGAMTHLEQDVGEATATRDRHAAYFMGLLANRDQVLKSPAQRAAVVELTAEIDNVRVGWQWAAQRSRLADLRQALPTLFYFYEIRSWYQEAEALFRQAAEDLQAMYAWEPGTDEAARILLGELLALQGWFAFRYSAFNLARDLAERSLTLLGPDSTAAALAEALPWLWPVRPFGQDYDAGARLLQRRIALLRARGDRWGEAGARLHLGALRQSQGDQREAYRVLRESLALYRATGDPVIVARCLGFVANAAYALEEYDEARHYAQESLEISRDLDDHFSMGLALHTLGQVAHREGRYGDARRLLEESMQRSLDLGYRWDIAPVLTSLARTLQALGAAAEAQRAFLESLAASQDMPGTVRVIETVLGLAGLLDEQDETELALALCLHILGHPVSRPHHREQAERLRARLEAALHAEEVAEIEERVQAQSLEDVVAELLARFPPASS